MTHQNSFESFPDPRKSPPIPLHTYQCAVPEIFNVRSCVDCENIASRAYLLGLELKFFLQAGAQQFCVNLHYLSIVVFERMMNNITKEMYHKQKCKY